MSKLQANVEFEVEKDDKTGLFSWRVKVAATDYDTKEEAVHDMSVVLEKLGIDSEDIDADEVGGG